MSISQTTPDPTLPADFHCPNCNALLPSRAIFCGSCGTRIEKQKQTSPLLEQAQDIADFYRITSLVRRRPYVNLYFALNNQQQASSQQRMVAIRDIDITNLENYERVKAAKLAQQEYDSLRHWQLPHIMAAIDLRYYEGHLFLVSALPLPSSTTASKDDSLSRLFTLQDYLQSGQGIPSEARTLEWIGYLCQAVELLHSHGIILGDLDPYTIILDSNSSQAKPTLMVSWQPAPIRQLLPPPTPSMSHMSYFSAPEALLGNAEPRSDIYSLGAILYLLLTGTPPDESTLRTRRRLRSPHELNPRIRPHVDECVMQALSVEPDERFVTVSSMFAALRNPRFRRPTLSKQTRSGQLPAEENNDADIETVQIVPLSRKNLERWQAARVQTVQEAQTPLPSAGAALVQPNSTIVEEATLRLSPAGTELPAISAQAVQAPPVTPPPLREEMAVVPPIEEPPARPGDSSLPTQAPTAPSWKQRITGILPAILPDRRKNERASVPAPPVPPAAPPTSRTEGENSWLKQLQRMLLGQQQHTVTAAAIIETPLRVQPDQAYTLRLHVMGRDEPLTPSDAKKGATPAGLSALVHGDTVLIEVRSAVHQSYTYLVQQATVTIPADGYAAEVTIPMQPLSSGANGRRDRLHIFFLDEQHNPLYEKPFVVELFVSNLVQFGREGHNVLTIPI